jgi:hypothetical protein
MGVKLGLSGYGEECRLKSHGEYLPKREEVNMGLEKKA